MERFRIVPDPVRVTRSPRPPYWLLFSATVNLLLIGFVVAWSIAQPHRRVSLVTWQREILPSLSPADAQIVGRAAESIAVAQAEADRSIHAEYAQVRALLAANPPDKDSLETDLGIIAAIKKDEQAAMFKTFVDELTTLSPDGRAKIVKAMERESRRFRR